MHEYVSDHRLQKLLKKYLLDNKLNTRLPNLFKCGIGQNQHGATLVISNGEKARLFGVNVCRSAWACPHCTAKVMAQKGTDIACVIDAMKKWYNQRPIMITLTLPHTKNMSCSETYDILRDAYRMFVRQGLREKRKYLKKNNEIGLKGNDACAKFRNQLGIKYTVRVYEFTWGENSWHPHIHALFFMPSQNVKKATQYETELNERWWACAKYCTEKLKGKEYAESLFSEARKKHNALYISKSKENNLAIAMESSYYISGYGANNELTAADYKRAREGHFTPYQLIKKAYDEPKQREFYLKLFVEYALATLKHRRVEFSKHKGWSWKQLIAKWKQQEEFIQSVKKKFMEEAVGNWKVVYWFTKEQWQLLCFLEATTDKYIISEILSRAPNGRDAIDEYLMQIDPSLINILPYPYTDFIEQTIYDNKFKSAA